VEEEEERPMEEEKDRHVEEEERSTKEDRLRRRSGQQFYPRPGGDAAGITLNHQVRSGGPKCKLEAFLHTRIRVVLEMVLGGVCFRATNRHASVVAPPKKTKYMFGWYVSCG
jgi:hypothetical protein